MKKNIITLATIGATMFFAGCTQQVAVPYADGASANAEMVSADTATVDTQDAANTQNGANGTHRARQRSGKNSVHFAYDSNKLSGREKAKIARDAAALKNKKNIKVEGNSDEFGTDEYNYALALRRAKAVKDSMIAKGIDPKNIKVVSYGESNPECQDKTKECYQENRRADYK